MSPCVILACASAPARRRGQALLMDLGGRFGFHWQQQHMPHGGAVFCIGSAPPALEAALEAALPRRMGGGMDWLYSGWRQPVNDEQMALAARWWVPLQEETAHG